MKGKLKANNISFNMILTNKENKTKIVIEANEVHFIS
jgi:hypothetical protein